jgi:hypothetical protein
MGKDLYHNKAKLKEQWNAATERCGYRMIKLDDPTESSN